MQTLYGNLIETELVSHLDELSKDLPERIKVTGGHGIVRNKAEQSIPA